MQSFRDKLDPRLVSRARRLQHLTRLLQRELPADCVEHFHVAAVRNATLHIISDSPVWTTRLRQLASHIIDIVTRNSNEAVQHVNIRTRIRYQPAQSPARPAVRRHMSRKASEQLLQSASCIEDEGLKKALTKLARRGQQ